MTAIILTNGNDNVVLGSTSDNTYYGADGNDFLYINFDSTLSTTIEGGNGNDNLLSSKGNDFIYGGNGDDLLFLIAGNDAGYGGDGKDILFGDGETTEYPGAGRDVLYGGDGNDSVNGGGKDDVLNGDGGNDTLYGDRATNVGESTQPGNDRLYGGDGNDNLNGQRGRDVLDGGVGADKISGGLGGDTLLGGTGKDQFIYTSVQDSRSGSLDTILDFRHSDHDKINVSAIDANPGVTGDQHFVFIGSNQFHHTPGELRFAAGVLYGDADGNGVADFSVKVTGVSSLITSDFIL